ncbi:MAG: hypothetical protein AN487_14900 [Anabaena sp. CRKS33]|jgi:hypothetical protein|uniref:DUF4258 domain-containing protein n=1 Tax=Dolichospermum planctonicum TaxID=136072 RepID=UPI0007FC2A3F|nr:DUF4258 domain-containing protein [Dolichospermum planctonicum]MCW9682797.1 DUF4258 domain-containing protein [Dolichospermum planctonicum UHCC 0167]OBQ35714.1 MAG: hypothetical protein AN487_14900 [Anabaena sp. CRKS33]
MKPIRFTKHALLQCLERGTNEIEVTEAILNGSHKQGKQGRLEYRYDFQFNGEWQGRSYSIKRVSPIIAESEMEIVVITVYTFYF